MAPEKGFVLPNVFVAANATIVHVNIYHLNSQPRSSKQVSKIMGLTGRINWFQPTVVLRRKAHEAKPFVFPLQGLEGTRLEHVNKSLVVVLQETQKQGVQVGRREGCHSCMQHKT